MPPAAVRLRHPVALARALHCAGNPNHIRCCCNSPATSAPFPPLQVPLPHPFPGRPGRAATAVAAAARVPQAVAATLPQRPSLPCTEARPTYDSRLGTLPNPPTPLATVRSDLSWFLCGFTPSPAPNGLPFSSLAAHHPIQPLQGNLPSPQPTTPPGIQHTTGGGPRVAPAPGRTATGLAASSACTCGPVGCAEA